MQSLVSKAKDTADAFYMPAQGDVQKLPYVEWQRNGQCDYSVVASGAEVTFAEFGAGYTTDFYGYAKEVPFTVSPGSWSVSHAKMFTKLGWWKTPDGRKISYIAPTRAMFTAGQEMKQRIESGEWLRDEVTGKL